MKVFHDLEDIVHCPWVTQETQKIVDLVTTSRNEKIVGFLNAYWRSEAQILFGLELHDTSSTSAATGAKYDGTLYFNPKMSRAEKS
jgi:hypothetical protein